MPKIIAVANQKGGVGKTTSAVTLAAGLARAGHQTILCDLDSQGQCSTFLGLRPSPGVYDLLVKEQPAAKCLKHAISGDLLRPGLMLLPSDKRTATAQILAIAEGYDITRLASALATIGADYIVIDTSPSVGLLQESALYAADYLLVPVAVDYAAVEGLAAILDTLEAVNGKGGKCQLGNVLPTFHDETTKESAVMLDQVKERFGDLVLPPIHRATILRECVATGQTVWEHSPTSRAAKEYQELVNGVLDYE